MPLTAYVAAESAVPTQRGESGRLGHGRSSAEMLTSLKAPSCDCKRIMLNDGALLLSPKFCCGAGPHKASSLPNCTSTGPTANLTYAVPS